MLTAEMPQGRYLLLSGKAGKTDMAGKWIQIKPERSIIHRVDACKGKMAFFGFLPAVGDVMLVALGFMRANVPVVMMSMTVGKFLRYLLIGFGTEQIISWF